MTVVVLIFIIQVRISSILHTNPSTIAINSNIQSQYWLLLKSILPAGIVEILEWSHIAIAIVSIGHLLVAENAFVLATLSAAALVIFIDLKISYSSPPKTFKPVKKNNALPNIVMIGCDTFRADYLGKQGPDGESLTPNLDKLTKESIHFRNMTTPIPRTAPSLAAMFSGQWPTNSRLVDNFTNPNDVEMTSIISELSSKGYRTCTHSDWAGSDFDRYDFKFDEQTTPPDQWNIRYLLKQGAKQYRLFFSLFTAGKLGFNLLPEIHSAAGVPQNQQATHRFCNKITEYGQAESPFLLNLFISTAHPPFGSESPYYQKYSNSKNTNSPFCMIKLTEPEEIIKSQKDPRKEFDLDQILALYQGCINNFDKRVGDIIQHLKNCELYEDCAIVFYSDHGIDFFEKNSWGQGNNLDGLYSHRIPCLIKTPKTIGTINDCFFSNKDILPILINTLGLNSTQFAPSNPAKPDLPSIDKGKPVYLETGVWLTRPPGIDENHLYYSDIDKILDVSDQKSGQIIIPDNALEEIESAKDRGVIFNNWILIRKPMINRTEWKLYNLLEDPEMKNDCSKTNKNETQLLKDLLNDHFFGSA
ncbi:sulfatase-like hydrolase/transferase [Aestuariirhabdus sp. Z084]|uniref:sulfatase family protein n=1 Tax=Aestuariirhabdus haliotis TaxID=2918751 RepID=UPI00201B37CF|nr:sulfatase-like hydrolase/transferase [Aestuariirhabdus haliotis]MCL6414689.1 sulfatase-like hydrolase/transferase [Aestuariirhabdus haliotis]MCL6418621.1 sulfatase-like hydrolase/transferase [Aestuariirhabdus haliotis]